jgi:hypothetical protein
MIVHSMYNQKGVNQAMCWPTKQHQVTCKPDLQPQTQSQPGHATNVNQQSVPS